MTDTEAAPVAALLGEGMLARSIRRAFDDAGLAYRIGMPDPGAAVHPVALVVSDAWDTGPDPIARKALATEGISWLPVHTELGSVVIGPTAWLGQPGCPACAESRRRQAHSHLDGYEAVWRRHATTLAQRPSAWLTTLGCDLVGEVVADEVARLHAEPGSARTRHSLLRIDLETLEINTHRFLPDPFCPDCGGLPPDSEQAARITLSPRPKLAPHTHRVRAVAGELDTLERTYVDAECGLIRKLEQGNEAGLAVAVAAMGRRPGGTEAGYGRSRSYRDSRLIALLEALERYGGIQVGGKHTVVRASYDELRGKALDPRLLGLYPAQRYERPGFPFQPFAQDKPCRWVWGYSFARQAPILVPEAYAYWGARSAKPEDRPFVYEISNGCALGGCLEEAILYGILEIAERDAFLMTWYTRRPAPRLELSSARDHAVPLTAQAISAQSGYRVMVFDITVEQELSCVWAMAVGPDDADDQPKAVCAAGSHLDPERATLNALNELGPMLATLIRRFPGDRDRARRMVDDPSLVKAMLDHQTLYGCREAFHRLDFLTGVTETRDFAELAGPEAFRHHDLRDDLLDVIQRYLADGLDVIVVDQTTPEHRAGGFSCVKVIIPGMLPMTFGHDFRRVDGLPRLHEVPVRLGYGDHPLAHGLAPGELHTHPHPFA